MNTGFTNQKTILLSEVRLQIHKTNYQLIFKCSVPKIHSDQINFGVRISSFFANFRTLISVYPTLSDK